MKTTILVNTRSSNSIETSGQILNTICTPITMMVGGLLVGGVDTNPNITAALIDTPNRDKHTAYVSSTGLTDGGDNLHFSAASLRTFGQRYYDAIPSANANT